MSGVEDVTLKAKRIVLPIVAIIVGMSLWHPASAAGFVKSGDLPDVQAQAVPAARTTSFLLAQNNQAPAAANVPRRTETITYGAWVVTCSDTIEKNSKKTCSGILEVVEQKQRRVLLAWIIGRDPQGTLRTVIQTPTGVRIANGVVLKLGKGPQRTLPYTACESQRCEASMAMDDAMIKDALASHETVLTIVTIDGRDINFKMDIGGIDKVFADLRH